MSDKPILILGGGINGAAAARELVLSGVGVWLVDAGDLADGATAYSSRLIHGGLRYLEFAEFSLVKESLEERGRLLRLAPHLVQPLRLFIPVRNRWGGLTQAAGKFLGLGSRSKKSAHRGLRVVQMGLWLYDRFAKEDDLPHRSLHRPDEPDVPRVNPALARRLWAYSDAQIVYPERIVIDFLCDAQSAAAASGVEFRVLTRAIAALVGTSVEIYSPTEGGNWRKLDTLQPAAIINATGAWVDDTLRLLPVSSPRLMRGTKGSHFLTFRRELRELLNGHAIYTEARDGRPVFILPFSKGTLVGTTDIPFDGDPATAVATEEELDYLLAAVGDVFPTASLARSDIAMHYCGVRPLPYVDAKTPAAITRRHQLVWNDQCPVPLVSLVGGKLTTCRSLAEETAAAVLARLGRPILATSRDRQIPPTQVDQALAAGLTSWKSAAAWSIQNEWATRLEDLVERRLMLHFSPGLSRQTLAELATVLVQQGQLTEAAAIATIDRCQERLKLHFGLDLSSRQHPT